MNKKILSLMCITCIFTVTTRAVHELRTPLSLNSKLNLINGSFHYPLKYVDEEKTNADLWGGAYYRQACKGFCPKVCDWCCNACCEDCVTCVCDSACSSCNSGSSSCSSSCCSSNGPCAVNTNYIGCFDCCGKKVSLAKLFFGKSSFRGDEIFGTTATGIPDVLTDDRYKLTPKIDYKEKGVVLGIHLERKVTDKNWRIGFNAALPIKKIEVEADLTCDSCCTIVTEGEDGPVVDLTGRYYLKAEHLYDEDNTSWGLTSIGESFAYRLDLLNELELVDWSGTSITVAGVDIGSDVERVGGGGGNYQFILPAAVFNPIGTTVDLTDTPWLLAPNTKPESLSVRNPIAPGSLPIVPSVNLNPLPSDGTISEGAYNRVDAATSYAVLSADKAQQEKIFVVPAFSTGFNGSENLYTAGGLTIKNKVEQKIRELNEDDSSCKKGPELLFAEYGVCLTDKQCVTGLGDLDTSVYVAYDFTDRSFAEIVFGMRFPTGKKNGCPGKIYHIPTGNNGHFEAKLGVDGGWRSKRWFGIHAEAYYTHVLEAIEKRPAQFCGATVRGIGPCVDAKVKWGYFVGHLDMTVFHPENQKMGFALGYEIYYKRHDKVQFCGACLGDRAEDFLGNIVKLSSSLAEVDTNILAHKIRGQVYHRWNYFELYAGASRVVGGWNGMLENEVHIGFGINF